MRDLLFRLTSLIIIATVLAAGSAGAFVTQPEIDPQDVTLASYRKARSVLDRALEAYGGLEAIRSVSNFIVTSEVEQFHRNQSRKPGVSERTLGRGEIIVDLKNNRYRYDVARGVIGGNQVESYEIITGKEGIFVDMSRRSKRPRPPSPNWQEGFTARVLPQILLSNVHKRAATLRSAQPLLTNACTTSSHSRAQTASPLRSFSTKQPSCFPNSNR